MNEPFHCVSCNSVDIPLSVHGRCSRCGSEAVVSAHVVEAPPAVEENTSDIRPKADLGLNLEGQEKDAGLGMCSLEQKTEEPKPYHCGCGFFHTVNEKCGAF